MKISLKILIILFVFIILNIPAIQSFSINMNLDPIAIPENTENNTTNIDNNTISDSNIDDNESSNIPKAVSSSEDDEFLTIENILSIILIVIGILIILLGIAILIRFK